MERLIPYGPAHLLQGSIHIVEPGGGSDGMITHDGEEVGYVIEGALELTVGGEVFALTDGRLLRVPLRSAARLPQHRRRCAPA